MAKVSFNKLNLKKNDSVSIVSIEGNDIEIKQYLPVAEKLNIITNVLNNSADEYNFANPVKIEVFFNLELVYAYTNLTFTDKQKEDPTKLYDLLESNGIINLIINALPKVEYENLYQYMKETIKGFYKQRNSALGIFEAISADYSNLNFDASAIQEKISDPNNLTLLKDVMDKLG